MKRNDWITALVTATVLTLCLSGCQTDRHKDMVFESAYDINASLDPEAGTLAHTTQIRIQNTGQDSTKELYFHLYGNLYKTETEGIKVVSVADPRRNNIPFAMQDDDQLIRLTLPEPLEGGAETTLTFDCEVKIPEMTSIYGAARDGEIQLAFFHPQLCVYDRDGWNRKPLARDGDGRYLAASDYKQMIESPSAYVIGCNGDEVSKTEQDGKNTYVFEAKQRRELLFFAHTDYIRMERTVGNVKILGYFNPRLTIPVGSSAQPSVKRIWKT